MTGLLRADLANLRRDPMLLASGLAPLLVAAILALGFAPLADAVAGVVDLEPHRSVIVGGALLLTPLLVGYLVGFLLVEEREERILEAVAVTPRGTDGFLVHRLALPAVGGAVASVVVAAIVGSIDVGGLLTVAILSAAMAVLVTLTMVAVARDRVQALAVSKLTGILLVGAVGYQFVGGGWRVLLGVLPGTWVVEAVVADSPWMALGLGLGTHLLFGLLLWRRTRRLLYG
jgi:hypothetical protein